ncbi:5-formyltetrahydrofolate cyclo-ligase [Aspergillus novofumigatus IBT 16806]|uniref:5-formyltetrahydrofolate cyclo-ligase n=1 Tax=Aspergillus novofumigatus (strain IBT 16806) TaxID=1392255 RepID=A0A2I1BZ21_ASPN1|nr:putative 5-formyltetrahydrofolate cyclo-ligase [Aspergillus novofumigatus IBT 16806]PKX90627.1 putative 5-formyltetrahydrofolate cyclo-ligase [Aspergillus novofumigatus IBT 16806]
MASGLQTAKRDLRKKIRDVLQKTPNESIVHQSRVATDKLFSLTEYQNAKRIGVYLSMPSGELSTTAIVQDALSHGKEVFVPYIHSIDSPSSTQKKTSIMDMLLLQSMEEFTSLEPDKWGIPSLTKAQVENKRNCFGTIGVSPKTVEDATQRFEGLDLIIMPGMAFDQGFRRLGHGKGYYDHFLTRYSKKVAEKKTTTSKMPLLVALSLKEQMLPLNEEIPVADHDWPVDMLVIGDGRFLVRQS